MPSISGPAPTCRPELIVRLRRAFSSSVPTNVCSAVATSDAFDSPQSREDYRDVYEKPALALNLAPQLVGARQNKEAVLGRLCFARQPDPMPTAEGPENKEGGTPPDYVFRGPRPPALHLTTAYSQ